jgi:hypothetical protein
MQTWQKTMRLGDAKLLIRVGSRCWHTAIVRLS